MRLVPISFLKPGMVLAQDVLAPNSLHTRLLFENCVLNETIIERLKQYGLHRVYIKDGVSDDVQPLPSPITLEHKMEALDELESIFAIVQQEPLAVTKKELVTMQSTISNIISDMTHDKNMTVNIADLKSYDEYTYHHSISVTILSIAIGIGLGMSKAQLNKLGLCSILHDIGKVFVPIELINKPARLTSEEFQVVQQHALKGGEYLKKHQLCEEEIYTAVSGHHEWIDGTGYPQGLAGADILPFSRIISIADVYDALTSNRPYRKPMQPPDAVEYIMSRCGSQFDYEMVRAFMQKVDLYPVGAYVRLSDGRVCVVLDNEKPMRPIVRPLDAPDQVLDLYHDHSLLNVVIVELILPSANDGLILTG